MNESFNSSEIHDCTENVLQHSVDRPMDSCQNWQVKETVQRFYNQDKLVCQSAVRIGNTYVMYFYEYR